ncbi:MAG: GNAT family N-acetyltransferase [Oscillospiraceae bacterium]|nr:GNAT family N-acetyltransferase [Oscillospiraceae bacterium]
MPAGAFGGLGPRGHLTEEEKAHRPRVTKALILRISSYLKPYWLQFLFVFLAILLSAAIGLLPSIITGQIVDHALIDRNLTELIKLCLAALGAIAVSQIIGLAENYINSWISQRVIFDMKNQMYSHLQQMPHAFFTSEKQGDIITRMNTDIGGVSTVISSTLTNIVKNVATIVTTTIALFTLNWQLAIVGMLIIPLLILPTRIVGNTRFRLLTESQAKNDEMNQIINETLSVSGSMLVKLFTREKEEYSNFERVNGEVMKISLKEARSGRWFFVVMGMFTQVGPLLIYLAGGLIMLKATGSVLSVGTITATVALVNRLYRPVESLLNVGVDFTRSLALFTRIFDYLDRPITIKSPENGSRPDLARKDIVYDHVVFSYDPEKPLLTDINFTVPGGKMYAIVGPSGSGKSTVVNMLPRLYDVTGGSVSVGGEDVRDIDLGWLRSQIGVVTQETYLFNGTILDNLRYARADASMEEIEEACKKASIHDFIMKQPHAYETEVGNRGLKLSGGEKQRLSIARVILKDPKILILDEATSALDSISENAIQDALESMMQGRTSIVIAHRLSTILKADRILVVADGRIAEQGSHEELLNRNGVYRELYETQFRTVISYETGSRDGQFDIGMLSSEFNVRRITEAEISEVYRLYRENRRYYRNQNTKPSRRDLTEVISEVPEGTAPECKHFVGFYDSEERLTAILDLITGYPEKDDAFIGWFMVDAGRQRQGIGSQIFADVRAAMSGQGFDFLSVGVSRENTDAIDFWQKQGFTFSGREMEWSGRSVALMERSI